MARTVSSETIATPRLTVHARVSGPADGVPLVLIHGNASSAAFFDDLLARLPDGVRGVAPDLRGFGSTEPKPIDATRGVRDFADDVHAMIAAMGLTAGGRKVHLLGWSVGGAVAMQVAIDHPAEIASLVLEAPMSPHGFGGTRDTQGNPCTPDWAGTGGGTANPEFVQRIGAGDASEESPFSPRNVMNAFYFRPPFRVAKEREDRYTASILSTKVGEDHYAGDLTTTEAWPGIAPGTRGMNNAISGKYVDLTAFSSISPKPPVLWVRGADDQIVSDTSLFDLGFLGQVGAVPGWPGADAFPAQPMIGQTRAVLDAYAAGGGAVREVVLPECGHSPHIEKEDEFLEHLTGALGAVGAGR